jgi:hypothetical protein
LFLFLSVIKSCQTALAGFPKLVVQVNAGVMHGTADHIIADITGAGKKIA